MDVTSGDNSCEGMCVGDEGGIGEGVYQVHVVGCHLG